MWQKGMPRGRLQKTDMFDYIDNEGVLQESGNYEDAWIEDILEFCPGANRFFPDRGVCLDILLSDDSPQQEILSRIQAEFQKESAFDRRLIDAGTEIDLTTYIAERNGTNIRTRGSTHYFRSVQYGIYRLDPSSTFTYTFNTDTEEL